MLCVWDRVGVPWTSIVEAALGDSHPVHCTSSSQYSSSQYSTASYHPINNHNPLHSIPPHPHRTSSPPHPSARSPSSRLRPTHTNTPTAHPHTHTSTHPHIHTPATQGCYAVRRRDGRMHCGSLSGGGWGGLWWVLWWLFTVPTVGTIQRRASTVPTTSTVAE